MSTSVWGNGGGKALISSIEKQASIEEKFKAENNGVDPVTYVANAERAAYAKTSEAQGFQGRSEDGIYHSTNSTPTTSPSMEVVAYHNAEDEGKECARNGNLDGAIAKFTEAANLRRKYEEKHGLTSDTGHATARKVLMMRRSSLTNLKIDLKDNDPDVVGAKRKVREFYHREGGQSPI